MSARYSSSLSGQTPLTDLRSLGSSALFHGLVLFLASATVLNMPLPVARTTPKVVRAELSSHTDNHRDQLTTVETFGSDLSELGGLKTLPPVLFPEASTSQHGSGDSVDGTLLADILPPTQFKPREMLQEALTGPKTSGHGLMSGSGKSSGNEARSGSGMGAARGSGSGTRFFGIRDRAHSFAYVVDCSGSMATCNALEVAKRELLASVGQLAPDAEFGVIFYNLEARILADRTGRQALMAATVVNKAWMQSQLAKIGPDGGTDHMMALHKALNLRPEVIFFLTDGDLMTNGDVDAVLSTAGATRIQAVEFGFGTDLGQHTPLSRLAAATGGTYRFVDVSHFPRSNQGFNENRSSDTTQVDAPAGATQRVSSPTSSKGTAEQHVLRGDFFVGFLARTARETTHARRDFDSRLFSSGQQLC
jgi:hypothetical protein